MANSKDTGKSYPYAIAKNVLSDTEKNRCLCLFLSMDHSSINWAKATEEFECKSIDSMRVMTRATLKKITDAEKNGGALPVPAGKGAGGGKKRKASASADDGGEGEGTGSKRKGKVAGGRKKVKKADTPVEEDGSVKQEAEEEIEDEF